MDYSYENYYQAVRRFWRFGQKSEVNVYIVIGSTEQNILNVVREKQKRHNQMKYAMYQKIKDFQNAELKQRKFKLNIEEKQIEIPQWLGA